MAICSKVKHKGYIEASNVIDKMKRKYGGSFGVYYCAGCNAYHLTSNTKDKSGFVKFKR